MTGNYPLFRETTRAKADYRLGMMTKEKQGIYAHAYFAGFWWGWEVVRARSDTRRTRMSPRDALPSNPCRKSDPG